MAGVLDHVRELYRRGGFVACWKWALDGKGPHNKAKRFAVLAVFSRKHKEQTDDAAEKNQWLKRQQDSHRESVKYEERYEARTDIPEWPESVVFTELLYHNPPHLHMATCDRAKLIALCQIAQKRFGLRIGEFPPFDPVEAVHVSGSYHYRQSGQCSTPRNFSNRGDGLAADLNDLDGGNDSEYQFYLELKRRYQ